MLSANKEHNMRLSENKAAKYLGLSKLTLRSRRHAGNPLVKYLNVDGRAWYDPVDLDEYLNRQTMEPRGKVADV